MIQAEHSKVLVLTAVYIFSNDPLIPLEQCQTCGLVIIPWTPNLTLSATSLYTTEHEAQRLNHPSTAFLYPPFPKTLGQTPSQCLK